MTESQTSAVVVENLSRSYLMGEVTVHALRGVSLQIEQGEFVAILGQSGSGKTTLLNLVAALDVPTSGFVIVSDMEVSSMGRDERTRFRREHVGIIFQAYNLFSTLTAVENVEIGISLSVPRDRLNETALKYLDLVGIAHLSNNYPSQLSGGEQQRVAIARGLAKEPPLLVLDEPTGNLDAETSEEIWKLILRMNQETGTTVLAVTHQTSVSKVASRSIFLRSGQIYGISEGETEDEE